MSDLHFSPNRYRIVPALPSTHVDVHKRAAIRLAYGAAEATLRKAGVADAYCSMEGATRAWKRLPEPLRKSSKIEEFCTVALF